jgi:hypothetical protein
MTPDNASSQRKPAAGHRCRRQVDHTLIRSILRPGRPIAPTSADMHTRGRTLRHTCLHLFADQAARRLQRTRPTSAVGNRQISIDARPDPAGSFPGGFRTPILGVARYVSTGRHPKPFTRAEVSSAGRRPW